LIKAQSRLGELEAVDRRSRAEAAVSVAQSHIRLSDAAYKARLRQLKTTANREGLVKVTTPISGVIVDRPVTPGETVTVEAASKPLMTVENNQRVWATANLYEKDLAPVKLDSRFG
jgi:multidrug resistance efflux pump